MWNTSVLALGSLASPLTQTIGVVHTMAVLLTLSFALSAPACRPSPPMGPVVAAAWLGGLVYGFSSFALEEAGSGRITYVYAVIHRCSSSPSQIDRQRMDTPGRGLDHRIAGGRSALRVRGDPVHHHPVLALALVALALIYHADVVRRAHDVLRTAAAAVVVFALFSAYPLYVQFLGPDRITGPPQSPRNLCTSVRMRRASSHRDRHSGSTSAGQIASRARSRPRVRQRSRSTSAFRSSCSSSAASCCFAARARAHLCASGALELLVLHGTSPLDRQP